MPNVILNGRFLTRSATGVDRVAEELVVAFTKRTEGTDWTVSLALPNAPIVDEAARSPLLLNLPRAHSLRMNGYAWEQIALPLAAKGNWLLSLCNMGPLASARQAIMVHDAQVFIQPDAYSKAFRAIYHILQPRLVRRAKIALTVSDHSRRDLEKFMAAPTGKIQVVHNGADHMDRIAADPDTLSRYGLQKDGFLLAIGSLAPHKNLAMLIEAAKARSDRTLPLVIAGGGNERIFQNAGLSGGDGVTFLGRVTDEELKALYTAARVLVFPSKTEGFGLPPLEAMRCGCGVIASTGGAIPETSGSAPDYLSPDDVAGWAQAMSRAGSDMDYILELRRRGRDHARTCTWENAAQKLLTAFENANDR